MRSLNGNLAGFGPSPFSLGLKYPPIDLKETSRYGIGLAEVALLLWSMDALGDEVSERSPAIIVWKGLKSVMVERKERKIDILVH